MAAAALLFESVSSTLSYVPAIFMAVGAVGAYTLYVNSYRRAIDRTISHGRLVESVIDLYRLSLLDALGFRRPRNQEEERELFQMLSFALAGVREVDSFWYAAATGDSAMLSDLRSTLDAAMDELPGRLRATVDDSVSQAVRDSVDRDLPRAVTESVLGSVEQGLGETLRRTLAGPRLDNFDGHLSVTLLDGGTPVRVDNEGSARMIRDHEYQLVISIGQEPSPDATTVPVRIRGGNEHPTVTFAVSIDSNVLALRQAERSLAVGRHSDSVVRFPLQLDHSAAESNWLWIRVTQHERTIQNLELTLNVTDNTR